MSARLSVRVSLAALLVFALSCELAQAGAPGDTYAGIVSSLRPDRLGAKGALAFDASFSGGEFGIPSPVRRAVLKFPAGMGIEIPVLRSCAPERLRSRGPGACPAQSEIGRGSAVVEAHLGSQMLTESVALRMFVGPLRNLQPTVEIIGQGYTPFKERLVFGGTALSAEAPYGEELVLTIPPIATLPLEPDASILTLSLTLGADGRSRAHDANTVIVPASCPSGGFPFAAEFTYADGASASAQASDACPG